MNLVSPCILQSMYWPISGPSMMFTMMMVMVMIMIMLMIVMMVERWKGGKVET